MVNAFVHDGHTVAGCARTAERMQQLSRQFGTPHRFDPVDLADGSQVSKWAQDVLTEMGPPDFLINAAAIINQNAPLWQVPAAEFSSLVDINVKGVFHTIRNFVPAMTKRGRGVIVNFSSYWGRSTSSDVAAYCASKWAIEGLSRGLADDLPAGLASVAFNPGIIHTEMLTRCFGAGAAAYPSPEKWAEVAVPFILGLGPQDNGKAVTVPGF